MKIVLTIILFALLHQSIAQFTELTPDEYLDNQVIENALNYGGNYVISSAVNRGVFPSGDFHIANLTKVEQQNRTTTVNYRFSVNITSTQGVRVNGNYTVNYRASNQTYRVIASSYSYRHPSGLQNSTYSWANYTFEPLTEEEENVEGEIIEGQPEENTETEEQEEEQEEQEESTEENNEEEEQTEEENNEGEEESGTPPPVGYVEIPPDVYLLNQTIEDGLNFGANYILTLAIGKNVYPSGDFKIANLLKVEERPLKNGVDYRYTVNITSAQGVKVNGRYAVYYRNSNSSFKVVSYNYNYTYPTGLQDSPFSWQNYNFEQGGGEEETPTEEYTCEEYTCEEEICEEQTELPTEETETETPPTEEETTNPEEYVELDPDVYLQSQVIEDALNFGGNYIVFEAVNKNVYPSGDFRIANLTKVEQLLLKDGADYRFTVNITSAQGVKVNGQYTVYYSESNQTYRVIAQNYRYTYPGGLNDTAYSWENYSFGIGEEEEEEQTEEETTPPPVGVWFELSPSVYLKNQTIADGLNYGGNYLVSMAVGKNFIPSGDFKIANLTKVEERLLTNGLNWRYTANITSAQGVKVNARYAVYYRRSNSSFNVVSYNYNYTYPSGTQDSNYTWTNYTF